MLIRVNRWLKKAYPLTDSRRLKILAFLTFVFLFRFIFGLYCPPVTAGEDYLQTYVIGLKSYTTHTWPYFGPDVQGPETSFKTQIPGALEGLLIALPLQLWPAPESPYLFLNLLSFLALSFFGWYCCKRLPGFSPWFIFTWIYIAPWNTHYSTQVINPSYAFLGSVIFFVGFLETVPALTLNVIPARWANTMMGFGLFWVMQLHMSWVAFVPFLFFSLYSQRKTGEIRNSFIFLFLGSIPMLALLIPTYLTYGFSNGKDVHGFVSALNWNNAKDILGTLARYLSVASFEMPRFVAEHTRQRIDYFVQSPWLLLPGAFLWLAGYFQPGAMIVLWFFKDHPRRDWNEIKWLMAGTFFLIYACFLFTPDMAASFRVILLFPIVMIYSLYCWDYLAKRNNFWRILGMVFILAGVYFQVGYTLKNIQAQNSLYAQNQELMVKAIEAKDYRLLAERRPGSLY